MLRVGEAIHVVGPGVWEILYLPLNFAMNLEQL